MTEIRAIPDVQGEMEELRRRLEEAEATLHAIRAGEVDALVVNSVPGHRVFVLEGADRPYRMFVEGMSQGAATVSPEGVVLYCNRSFAGLFEASGRAAVGERLAALVLPEHAGSVRRALDGAASTPRTLEVEIPGAGDLPVSVELVCTAHEDGNVAVVATDLTERLEHAATVAHARALRERDRQLRLAMRAARMGAYTHDLLTGQVEGSAELANVVGFDGVLPGTADALWEAVHPEDRARVRAHMDQVFASAALAYRVEYRTLRPDGSVAWIESCGDVLRDADGRAIRTFGVMRDVSTEKRATVDLQQLNTTLEDQVKSRTDELSLANERLTEFTFSVAHDLRAPIRAVRGYLDALFEDLERRATPAEHEYGRRMAEATEKLDRLLNDLLVYSRLDRIELAHTPVRLDGVVRTAAEQLVSEVAATGATIEVDVPRETPPVLGHAPTLVQAVANLIANALKFVPPDRAPHVEVACERRGERVRLWVRDNGIGIEPQHRERIFRMFETLDRSYPGTGLGLAMVRRSVERMNGSAGVEGRADGGSAFWIEVPVAR